MNITIDDAGLSELIRRVVLATIAELEQRRGPGGDRIAYTEEEAARMLGMKRHALRDERLRGRVTASMVAGRRPRYTLADLVDYLSAGKSARDDFGVHGMPRKSR